MCGNCYTYHCCGGYYYQPTQFYYEYQEPLVIIGPFYTSSKTSRPKRSSSPPKQLEIKKWLCHKCYDIEIQKPRIPNVIYNWSTTRCNNCYQPTGKPCETCGVKCWCPPYVQSQWKPASAPVAAPVPVPAPAPRVVEVTEEESRLSQSSSSLAPQMAGMLEWRDTETSISSEQNTESSSTLRDPASEYGQPASNFGNAAHEVDTGSRETYDEYDTPHSISSESQSSSRRGISAWISRVMATDQQNPNRAGSYSPSPVPSEYGGSEDVTVRDIGVVRGPRRRNTARSNRSRSRLGLRDVLGGMFGSRPRNNPFFDQA